MDAIWLINDVAVKANRVIFLLRKYPHFYEPLERDEAYTQIEQGLDVLRNSGIELIHNGSGLIVKFKYKGSIYPVLDYTK